MQTLTHHVNLLSERVHAMRSDRTRVLVGIAGAPASGKTTLAEELSRRLNLQKCDNRVVSMDGFHLDNSVLEERDLLNRKGAPETFDVDGFMRMIRALRAREMVVAPIFDRTRDISIAGAVAVPPNCPVVIVEGNYLMFDEAPWKSLESMWGISARLDIPMPELRARLIQRWLNHNLSRAAATRRAESNDIPNAQRVVDKALSCDFQLTLDDA